MAKSKLPAEKPILTINTSPCITDIVSFTDILEDEDTKQEIKTWIKRYNAEHNTEHNKKISFKTLKKDVSLQEQFIQDTYGDCFYLYDDYWEDALDYLEYKMEEAGFVNPMQDVY